MSDRPVLPCESRYRPYPVDWRFLPEQALFVKDTARFCLVSAADAWAHSGRLTGAWYKVFGDRVVQAVERAGVLLIHVPKTGGTSISKVLYGKSLPHYTASFYDDVFGRRLGRYPRFAVIRHPIARFISAYKFMAGGGSDIILTSRFERLRLRRMEPIDGFVKFLFDEPSRIRISPLFATQSSFVTHDDTLRVDRLFPMDESEGISEDLMSWLGVSRLPHLNRTEDVRVNLSSESLGMLATLYASDFDLYAFAEKAGRIPSLRGRRVPRRFEWHDTVRPDCPDRFATV